jgi:hypothetical protein
MKTPIGTIFVVMMSTPRPSQELRSRLAHGLSLPPQAIAPC